MNIATWAIVFATLLGPVLAVQAQKWLERARERHGQKRQVFDTLMATRATRLAAEHVRALNSIDLVFYGSEGFRGRRSPSKTEQAVLNAWREYHDHLGTKFDDTAAAVWNVRADELFVNLLFAISEDVRLKFDRVQLKKSVYSPQAHTDLETEQTLVRRLLLKLLAGDRPLKMEVVGFPADEELAQSAKLAQQRLASAIGQDGTLKVRVENSAQSGQQGA